jgi:hypothetical protein
MRAFAEFVMRGRLQATGVCVASAILPLTHWIGSAVVGLVVLRRGPAEGAMLLMWTSLPLVAWYMVGGDASPLLVLAGVGILSMVLRVTVSWEVTLSSAVVVAAIAGLSYELLSAAMLSMLVEWYVELLAAMDQALSEEDARDVLVGFFALGQAYAMIAALLLARWWQSTLYNPGGFGMEFRALRLSPPLSIGLVAVIAACFAMGDPAFGRWIPLLTVPLVISAIALVHWLIRDRQLGTNWVVAFYLVLFVMIQLLYPLLASVALLDSWINLRKKFGTPDNEV